MPLPKNDDLMDSLRKAERQVIHGVVYPSGGGASRCPGDALWRITFTLAAWSFPDGPVHRSELIVCCDVKENEIATYREWFPYFGVVALEVGLPEHPGSARPRAWLHAVLPEDPKAGELLQIAEELRQPVITDDPQFGKFLLDRRVHWHEAHTLWGLTSVRLSLHAGGDDEEAFPQDSLVHARALWSDQERWAREIRAYMVQELLELKNGTWIGEDESDFTADTFLQRVTLQSITVDADGAFEFWYDDGDLFGGHAIMVSGTLEGGLNDAGIHG